MEEARRLLRHVVPGTLFLLEMCVLWLMGTQSHPKQIFQGFEKVSTAGGAILFLAIAGALGSLLAIAYHFVLWELPSNWVVRIADYRQFWARALQNRWIRCFDMERNEIFDLRRLSTSGAWRMMANVTHSRKEANHSMKAIMNRTETMCDIVHGLGAATIGIIASFPASVILWNIFHFQLWPFGIFWAFIFWLGGVCLHVQSYNRTVMICQPLIEGALFSAMHEASIRCPSSSPPRQKQGDNSAYFDPLPWPVYVSRDELGTSSPRDQS